MLSPFSDNCFRFARPFSSGTPAPLDPPEIPSGPTPEDEATGITGGIAFSWNASDGATSYDLYIWVSTGSKPGTPTHADLDEPAVSAGAGLRGKVYNWQVTAKGPGGETEGPVWSFTTLVAAPAAPTTPSPADDATGVAITAVLSWGAVAGATSYKVYLWLASGSKPGTPTATVNAPTVEYDPADMANYADYKWQVHAVNAGGETASAVWDFRTVSTILTGLYGAWNHDADNVTDSRDSTWPTGGSKKTLTQSAANFLAATTGGVVGGRIYRADTNAGLLYLEDATFADLNAFTIAVWNAYPGLLVTGLEALRNPHVIRLYVGTGSNVDRARFQVTISNLGTDLELFLGYTDGDSVWTATKVYDQDISATPEELRGWHLNALRFDGTNLKWDFWSSARHASGSVAPSNGLKAITTGRVYVSPNSTTMLSTTNESDNVALATRAWTDAELEFFYNSRNGRQYPFS